MSTADLLDAWRAAVRAAQLAEDVAREALAARSQVEEQVRCAREVADLADQAAAAANRTAATARAFVNQAEGLADDVRQRLEIHDQAVSDAKANADLAGSRYRRAARPDGETTARPSQDGGSARS